MQKQLVLEDTLSNGENGQKKQRSELLIQSPQLVQVSMRRSLNLPQWILDPLKDTWNLVKQVNAVIIPESSTEQKMVYKEHSLASSEHVRLPPRLERVLSSEVIANEDKRTLRYRRKRPKYWGPSFGMKEIILFHIVFFVSLEQIDRKF
eukprot:TRINITY_DN6678_c0_g1_i2.p4 TRINITY_DN6678_c0_g1~~TRINITY_DN6678_c0_g1_i2.p4  ORF type:complete len:149 (-),score=9.00 TRINITY_DN6678_c0_g1_i2:571-1017(-)